MSIPVVLTKIWSRAAVLMLTSTTVMGVSLLCNLTLLSYVTYKTVSISDGWRASVKDIDTHLQLKNNWQPLRQPEGVFHLRIISLTLTMQTSSVKPLIRMKWNLECYMKQSWIVSWSFSALTDFLYCAWKYPNGVDRFHETFPDCFIKHFKFQFEWNSIITVFSFYTFIKLAKFHSHSMPAYAIWDLYTAEGRGHNTVLQSLRIVLSP